MEPLKLLIKSSLDVGDNKVLPFCKNLSNGLEQIVIDYFLHSEMIEWTKEKLTDSWSLFRNKGKNQILFRDKVNVEPEDNIPENTDIFIYQPYGSQQYPDFLILRRTREKLCIIKLELKSSKNWKSTWNCGLPRPYPGCLYIHYNTKDKLMYPFYGEDLITVEEYKRLFNDVKHFKSLLKEHGKAKNFSIYFRQMFNQLHNYEVKSLESSVNKIISYLDTINKDYKTDIIFENDE